MLCREGTGQGASKPKSQQPKTVDISVQTRVFLVFSNLAEIQIHLWLTVMKPMVFDAHKYHV